MNLDLQYNREKRQYSAIKDHLRPQEGHARPYKTTLGLLSHTRHVQFLFDLEHFLFIFPPRQQQEQEQQKQQSFF